MTQPTPRTPSALRTPASRAACDALILLGASCQGPESYAQVAEELGYGRLSMPMPCDSETIRAQLEALAGAAPAPSAGPSPSRLH